MSLCFTSVEIYSRCVSGKPRYEKTTAANAKDHLVIEEVNKTDFIIYRTSSFTPNHIPCNLKNIGL